MGEGEERGFGLFFGVVGTGEGGVLCIKVSQLSSEVERQKRKHLSSHFSQ